MDGKSLAEELFGFAEVTFGLAMEVGATVVQRAIRYIKWVLSRIGIGLVLSVICGVLGASFDIGGLAFVGIAGIGASITFAFVALAPVILLLWTGQEHTEKIERFVATAFVLMSSFLVLGVYVVIFQAWKSKEIWILIVAMAIQTMATVMKGSTIDLDVITAWARRVSVFVILFIAISTSFMKLPEFYRARIADTIKDVSGLDSKEVPFEKIEEFFDSSGNPKIWFTEYDGHLHFFRSPGHDRRRGLPRLPIRIDVIDAEMARREAAKAAAHALEQEIQAAAKAKAMADARSQEEKERQSVSVPAGGIQRDSPNGTVPVEATPIQSSSRQHGTLSWEKPEGVDGISPNQRVSSVDVVINRNDDDLMEFATAGETYFRWDRRERLGTWRNTDGAGGSWRLDPVEGGRYEGELSHNLGNSIPMKLDLTEAGPTASIEGALYPVGTWRGQIIQNGRLPYDVVVRMNSTGGGITAYPSHNCGGRLSGGPDATGSFKYSEINSFGKCMNSEMECTLADNRTMSCSWQAGHGEKRLSASATLKRDDD